MATGGGSPCGACKFLRRKCAPDCVFGPYFCSEQGPARFAAIHKVFGASNVSKLLRHVPVAERCEAVVTIAYEAQSRIRDPVYGCVAHIFALQQQVAYLQAQLLQAKAQLAQTLMTEQSSRDAENPWLGGSIAPGCMGSSSSSSPFDQFPTFNYYDYTNQSKVSPQSSLDSVSNHAIIGKKRASQPPDLSELQALALRMMKKYEN